MVTILSISALCGPGLSNYFTYGVQQISSRAIALTENGGIVWSATIVISLEGDFTAAVEYSTEKQLLQAL